MGLIGQAVDAIGSVAEKAGIKLPSTKNDPGAMRIEGEFKTRLPTLEREVWSVQGQDWYQIFGYQFVIEKTTTTKPSKSVAPKTSSNSSLASSLFDSFNAILDSTTNKKSTDSFIYTLPIPPQNLVIKPVMANRITATVGGVVEEVSPVTFWIISMSGTTGIALGRNSDNPNEESMAQKFRQVISTTGLLSGIAAQANSILNKAGNIIDQITTGGIGNVVGAINNGLTPPLPYSSSAVDPTSNGFTEMQNLSKFLYLYQRLKSSYPEDYALFFVNNKTKQKWRIAVKDFTVQQNAQNPHLYRYQIQIQGWDMQASDRSKGATFDRFGPNGDLKEVNTTNVFDTVKNIQKIGKNIFG